MTYPVVLEAFHNHGGKQIKCYAIGDSVYAAVKPSIPDYHEECASVDGQWVQLGSNRLKCHSAFVLPFHSLENMPKCNTAKEVCLTREEIAVVSDIAAFIAARSGLHLFGYDVVKATAEPEVCIVVDVNAFPSFRSLSESIAGPSKDVASGLRSCLMNVLKTGCE
jgi:inositol-1,3,4-trisphosphate 5/6-kinase